MRLYLTGPSVAICCDNVYFAGAEVIMACRDEAKALQAVDDIKKSLGAACKISFMKLDLASLQSVRDFAAAVAESKFRFHTVAIKQVCQLFAVYN